MVGVAQLVRAPDCGSGGRRFDSDHPPHLMGCSQAVRHGTLTPACVGSNPAIPARKKIKPLMRLFLFPVSGGIALNRSEKQLWLIQALQNEMPRTARYLIPEDEEGRWRLLRGLFNIRQPMPASTEFLRIQGELLRELTEEKGVTDWEDLLPCSVDPDLYIWKGDITTLRADAIVNAANSALLGCFRPNHNCIDNMIHTMAGIELRQRCAEIMEKQGHEEETGLAKITSAYNLPSKYIIHTVGPIVEGALTREHSSLLASCYKSCLEIAVENKCKSIAFCCISTGVFGFPQQEAAEIAVQTVMDWKRKMNSGIKVIFNVFKDRDLEIYQRLLA